MSDEEALRAPTLWFRLASIHRNRQSRSLTAVKAFRDIRSDKGEEKLALSYFSFVPEIYFNRCRL